MFSLESPHRVYTMYHFNIKKKSLLIIIKLRLWDFFPRDLGTRWVVVVQTSLLGVWNTLGSLFTNVAGSLGSLQNEGMSLTNFENKLTVLISQISKISF